MDIKGGLVQLLARNWKNTVLTSKPEITYLRKPYKQHTIYGLEIIEERFNEIPSFGSNPVFCQLSKYGNLIKSIVLKITLPQVHIEKDIEPTIYNLPIKYGGYYLPALDMLRTFDTLIYNFTEFNKSSMIYWRSLTNELNNDKSNYLTIMDLTNTIKNTLNTDLTRYNMYNQFSAPNFGNSINFNFDILYILLNNYNQYNNSFYSIEANNTYKSLIKKYLNDYIFFQKLYLKYLISSRKLFKDILDKSSANTYKFSWLESVGIALIDSISLEIGGQKIDSLDKHIIDDWVKSNIRESFVNSFNECIGNVPELKSYDSLPKPEYTLFIPIPFGSLLYESQTISVINMKYQDIIVKLSLSNIEECCYFEPYEFSSYNTNIILSDQIKLIDASLLVEYVILSEKEQKLNFNKESKTLIEQHQSIQYYNIDNIPLMFGRSTKDITWLIQKESILSTFKLWNCYDNMEVFPAIIEKSMDSNIILRFYHNSIFNYYLTNYNDYIDGTCEIYNSTYYNGKYKIKQAFIQSIQIDLKMFIYSELVFVKLKPKFIQNIIDSEHISIFGRSIQSARDSMYFEHLQHLKHTSTSNTHKYSFSLYPNLYQPSGFVNFNKMKNKFLKLTYNKNVIEQIDKNNDNIIIKIWTSSYNIVITNEGYYKLLYSI